MALTPWPTDMAELQSATETLASAIGGTLPADSDRVQAIGSAASAMIERYAPGAPQAIRNEAATRFAGYLFASDFGGISKESVGPRDTEFVVNHGAAFRNCGAQSLLSPWKVRRAGVCE